VGRLRRPPLRALLLALLAAGCGVRGVGPEGEPAQPRRLTEWRVGIAEHLGLWYHGLAYVGVGAAEDTVLPIYRPGYVDSIAAAKRRMGIGSTPLEQRASEFRERFRDGEAYRGLQFLPLYFRDADALFSGIRLWAQAGGDPRRVGSDQAARVVAVLSTLFPRAAQRQAVAEWASVLEEETRSFYHAYWEGEAPRLQQAAAAVEQEWRALAPALANYLDYMRLRGGELFLVPALGAEGRTVTRGVANPRVAVLAPPPGAPETAVWSFVHELLYPLVGDVIREYLAPVRIRELGESKLATRAAVRGGAILLARAAPDRVASYRRFFLEQKGIAGADDEAAFARAFPLPEELERGLTETLERALVGL
jgi:hypothetical protein